MMNDYEQELDAIFRSDLPGEERIRLAQQATERYRPNHADIERWVKDGSLRAALYEIGHTATVTVRYEGT